jgi:hypothetical protein
VKALEFNGQTCSVKPMIVPNTLTRRRSTARDTLPRARRASRLGRVPSREIEYAYYAVVGYSLLASYLGVELPLIAAVSILGLTAICYMRAGSTATKPVGALIACVGAFVAIQYVFHDVPLRDASLRSFVLWICGLVLVRALTLRAGFLERCTIVIFALGLVAVPSLTFSDSGSTERAQAGIALSGNLRNANGLGAWFGFCFVSLSLLGLENRKWSVRLFYWSAAAASILITGLSVSRTAILASGIAVLVGFRDILKRGFAPLLVLLVLMGLVVESQLFDRVVERYEARGLEDTGRLVLWPHVVDRIWTSPLVGVGVNDLSTYIPERADSIATPHNSFLYIALSSGFVPLLCWALFWLRTGTRLLSDGPSRQYARFQLPFLLYALIEFSLGDMNNDPWVLVALAVAAAPSFSYAPRFPVFSAKKRALAARRPIGGPSPRPSVDPLSVNR